MSLCVVILASGLVRVAGAQEWNDARALVLVRQATDRRAQQLADSGLVDYQAIAHGYVTFLAQLGEGFREPPKIVKADELALQVYWHAPNLSKQRIIGRRDTTLLPTDIQYHRDHLGIVQNNFPAIIRLGEGDEVQDVPHPLSETGLREYDFALSDSLRMSIPGRVIEVYEVKVRPKNDRLPRLIGALYIDRDNGQVVRMAFSFTRAAFLDKQLEDLFVVLENGLVGTRFWLPRHQEIEIRRTATWLDYPVRGIIRGRWEIGEYQLNPGIPSSYFVGAEIVMAPLVERVHHSWPSARILDSLPPDVRAVTADEIRRVQAEARTLVREQALRRVRGSAIAARGISDFARFNRVEGVALGGGLSARPGGGLALTTRGRYGLSDHQTKGSVEASWQTARGTTLRGYYSADFRDVGDVAERSVVTNSLAAQELGSDYTDPYRVEGIGAGADVQVGSSRVSFELARERHRALGVSAAPAQGVFVLPVAAAPIQADQARFILDHPTALGWLGAEFRADAEVRYTSTRDSPSGCGGLCRRTGVVRGSFAFEVERPVGETRFFSRTVAAAVSGSPHLLAQELVFLGGPVSAPGYGYHTLIGDGALSQHLELQLPIDFPSFSLGRFGRSPGRAALAPHFTAIALHQVPASKTVLAAAPLIAVVDPLRQRSTGFYQSAGLSLVTGFDLLRFDLSRGFRDNRWVFSVDVVRTFWSVL